MGSSVLYSVCIAVQPCKTVEVSLRLSADLCSKDHEETLTDSLHHASILERTVEVWSCARLNRAETHNVNIDMRGANVDTKDDETVTCSTEKACRVNNTKIPDVEDRQVIKVQWRLSARLYACVSF